MSDYVSKMIGIRTGGVFDGAVDMIDFRKRIFKVADQMNGEREFRGGVPCLNGAISDVLDGGKGSLVVIAGIFREWPHNKSGEFSRRLSKEFGSEVIHLSWKQDTGLLVSNLWLNGSLSWETVSGFPPNGP